MSSPQTFQFQVTAEFKRELEEAAAKLNMNTSAYIVYLFRSRQGRLVEKAQDVIRSMLESHDESSRELSE